MPTSRVQLTCLIFGFAFALAFQDRVSRGQRWLSWNSFGRILASNSMRSACLSLPNAGIKGVHSHCTATFSTLTIVQNPQAKEMVLPTVSYTHVN